MVCMETHLKNDSAGVQRSCIFDHHKLSVIDIQTQLKRNLNLQTEGRKEEVFYLMTHSTHFIYGYIVSDIW